MTAEQITLLQIQNEDQSVLYSGSNIYELLWEYSMRSMIAEDSADLLVKWVLYRDLTLPDFLRRYDALYSDHSPLSDFAEHSVEVKTEADGIKTVETTNKYDYTTTESADSLNAPTYENYVTTYNNTQPRLESKRVDSGARITSTTADADDNVKTTTTEHTAASLTIDGTTYTADYVKGTVKDSEGYRNHSVQQLINETLDTYSRSLIYEYIDGFIRRYTFFAGSYYERWAVE